MENPSIILGVKDLMTRRDIHLMEQTVFEGKPISGIGMFFLYGLVIFSLGIVLSVAILPSVLSSPSINFNVICDSLVVLGVNGFGVYLLGTAALGTRPRKILVDDRGVRFLIGQKLEWEVLWGDIRAIGTSSFGGKLPRTGFHIRTDKKTFGLNSRDDFGPREKLVEAFRAIATRAAGPMVGCEDSLGWATELDLTFKADIICDISALKGKWHTTNDPRRIIHFMGPWCVGLFVAGIVIAAVTFRWPSTYNDYGPGVGVSIFLGIFVTALTLYAHYTIPVAVKFDDVGAAFKFPSGKMIDGKWNLTVRKVGMSEGGSLTIWFVGQPSGYIGYFPPEICYAVRQVYAFNKKNSTPDAANELK